MKTLDEAASIFIREAKGRRNAGREDMRVLEDHRSQYQALFDEAAGNERIRQMFEAMRADVIGNRVTLEVALWTAFVHGFQIATEMEKP